MDWQSAAGRLPPFPIEPDLTKHWKVLLKSLLTYSDLYYHLLLCNLLCSAIFHIRYAVQDNTNSVWQSTVDRSDEKTVLVTAINQWSSRNLASQVSCRNRQRKNQVSLYSHLHSILKPFTITRICWQWQAWECTEMPRWMHMSGLFYDITNWKQVE